jgi:formate-dependent nitrite reductase cytochrome c552 subunit
MSCVGCHDPHQQVARGEAFYDAKCVACHSGGAASAKVCRVGQSGCVGCHMPKVELPGAPLVFTDHQIRVVRAGSGYPDQSVGSVSDG